MRDERRAAGPAAWLLFALGLLAFAAASVLAITVFSWPAPEPTRAEESAPDMRPLLSEIAALRAEVSQLRLALAVTPPGTAPASLAPAPTEPASLQPLVEALDRLSAQLGARLPGIDAPPRQVESREKLRELLEPDEADWTDEEWEAWQAQLGKLTDSYFFWSEQHVLEAFGRPDRASAREDGTWVWEYAFSESERVEFKFAGGRVIEVWN